MTVPVFLLGSGFSRAISDAMPTVNDLRAPLRAFLFGDRPDEYDGDIPMLDDVEQLLTYLSAAQPFQSTAEGLENEAWFRRTADWLADLIGRAQRKALRCEHPPEWLALLLRRWHEEGATVITLNYDTLIEATLQDAVQARPASVYAFPMRPISQRFGGARYGPDWTETFELIKLHGSLTWYYSGASVFFGEPIYDTGLVGSWSPDPDLERIGRRSIQGLVPLIVPPTLTKSGFFQNDLVRAMWDRAREALENASRVYVIGYSLPPADTQMTGLLARTCRNRDVTVVDPNGSVADRYSALGCRVRLDYTGDRFSIERFVDDYLCDPDPEPDGDHEADAWE